MKSSELTESVNTAHIHNSHDLVAAAVMFLLLIFKLQVSVHTHISVFAIYVPISSVNRVQSARKQFDVASHAPSIAPRRAVCYSIESCVVSENFSILSFNQLCEHNIEMQNDVFPSERASE